MSKRAEEKANEIAYVRPLKEQNASYQRGIYDGVINGYESAEKDILSKITTEHLEGLKWIEKAGITSQPYPYYKYCKDLRMTLEKLLSDD